METLYSVRVLCSASSMKKTGVCWTFSALLVGICSVAGVGNVQAAWYWPFGDSGIDYAVELKGVEPELEAWLRELKLDKPDTSRDILTQIDLEQELSVRGERVRLALEAQGYYDGVILPRLEEGETAVLRYDIRPGPRYRVGAVNVVWEGVPLKDVSVTVFQTKVGEPIQAQVILDDAKALLETVGRRACLLKLEVSPLVKLQEGRRVGEVVLRVRHGAVANFGPTTVSGTVRVRKDVAMRDVTWREGQCYRERLVEETRSKLIENQLFSSVSISHTAVPDSNGEVPMAITVKERAARTLRAGGSFSSDEGVVLSSGWEHRNLWGGGEKLTADLNLGQEEQGLETSLRLPDFGADTQTLVLTGGLGHEERDAYVADTFKVGASVERRLARFWRAGLGVGFNLTQTEDVLAGNSEYGLLSFPGFIEYDSRRNVLDPKRGWLANLSVTPYTETFGDGGQFVKTQGSVQTYLTGRSLPLSPTLALRAAGGSIFGAEGQDVPADIRYYAGGGGSVRGYGYQTLGPRKAGEVVGGSSFVAASAEARLRFTEEFGGVVFMDSGNAFDGTMPESDARLYSSAGVGVRYFTAIGPIRADIAVPLDGKDVGARGYAVYVSIGQSF